MDHQGLTVERHVQPSGLWFRLVGELDVLRLGSVTTMLFEEVEARPCDVHVDLSGLRFLALAGADMLVELDRRLAVAGRHLRIAATNDIVERVFDVRRAVTIGTHRPGMPRGVGAAKPPRPHVAAENGAGRAGARPPRSGAHVVGASHGTTGR